MLEMTIVFTIATMLVVLIVTTIGIHYFQNRYIIERWKEQEDELSSIVSSTPISIVIICRNEGREMEENIHKLIEQQCADVEIIVVNAASTDTTLDALKRLTLQYPQLRQTYVPQSNTNANVWESAYILGARAARNEWVLYVHSTFRPHSDLWLRDLLRYTDPSIKAVIDYSNFGDMERSDTKRAWKRRCKKMTRTVRKGRAIVAAGGSVLIKRNWVLDQNYMNERDECFYICRRFPPQERVILRVQNRRPDFLSPL